MSKVKRLNFFEDEHQEIKKETSVESKIIYVDQDQTKPKAKKNEIGLNLDPKVKSVLDELTKYCTKYKYSNCIDEINKITKSIKYDKFKVAVVGEFSRGKSSLINKVLGEDVLAVGNLPTTAMLTKVSYNARKQFVYMNANGAKVELPFTKEVWKQLSADPEKKDPTGAVFIGSNQEWLKENKIEIIDTPGAGDLNENRRKILNESIIGTDGVIITISALAALSSTEEFFIRERILAQRFPHLMVVITRLDQIEEQDRVELLQYVKAKLDYIEKDLPLFVNDDFEELQEVMPDVSFGVEAIKKTIIQWANYEGNTKLKNEYISNSLMYVAGVIADDIENKQILSALDIEKQKEFVSQQKINLSSMRIDWENLNNKMLQRCNECISQIGAKIRDRVEFLVEQLQYESSHSNNLKNWWEVDYPFKIKTELMKISMSLDADLNKKIEMDVVWFNKQINEKFKQHVSYSKSTLADKSVFKAIKPDKNMEFNDINAKQNKIRIGTGIVSIASYILLSSMGPCAIVTSISSGLIGNTFSQKIFKKEIEEQRNMVAEAINQDVPQVIDKAIINVEAKLIETYNKIIKEATEKQGVWYETQLNSISQVAQAKENKLEQSCTKQKEEIEQIAKKIISI